MKKNFNSAGKTKITSSRKAFETSQKLSVSICVYLWLILLFSLVIQAQTLAPGAPGKDAHWASAGKQAVGTSASLESKVWFTLAQGAMTEVYYPNVTTANVHLLQFVVVNPKTKKVETEQDDAIHEIKALRPDSLSFQQINTAQSGEWTIRKTYTTDVKLNSILIDVQFESQNQDLNLYVYFDPSIENTGMHDTGYSEKDAFVSFEGDKSIALTFSSKIAEMTNGFYQISDGLEQLRNFGQIVNRYKKAENGNIVQMAKILQPKQFTAVLNIADTKKALGIIKFPSSITTLIDAAQTKKKGFAKCLAEYEKGWSDYVKTIPKVEPKYQEQFNKAAMVLKASEDKAVRGANVASLTIPWGGGANANEDVGGGYHLVWSRDLYQVVTAYMALNDLAAANRALDFLFNIQQKADGSFPQNSWLDGKRGWGSLQLDEVAYPLIMAYQLKRFDKATYENHVKRAADFLVKTGPKTPQERWEEKSGYSPSTIAAEIAGLVCAADIAKRNNDETSANLYLKTADDWQANVEKWTATTNGKYGDGNYYVRLTENGKPDANEKTVLNNGAGTFVENEIVDAGFLELVRLGIKSPDDPLIQKSVKIIDEQIKVNTPNGEGFYRYNHDGYGEMDDGRRWNWDGKYTGKGRLWALLSGERGQYELAFSSLLVEKSKQEKETSKDDYFSIRSRANKALAEIRLESMQKFANDGLMIPEQVWDKTESPKNIDKQYVPELKFGEGTGSATPLAWSMAQFVRLAVNLQAGRNLDTPDVVYNRYVLGKKSEVRSQRSEGKNSTSDCPDVKSYLYDENALMTIPQKNEAYPHILGGKGANSSVMRFAFFGLEKDIEIVGDFTGWKPCGLKFTKMNAPPHINDIVLKFPNSARVEYKLIVDGKWITDPLNPSRVDNGVGGENSFFTMPEYQATSWDKEMGDASKLDTLEIDSKIYGKRVVKVYSPTNEKSPLPTLYLQDGTDYINRGKAIQIQYNLVQAGKIKPFIMVFIDPKDRTKEYWASDEYARFLATEVVPAIDAKYNTIKSRDGRAVLGASLGGITSVWTSLKYPETFSRVGGQSSSFWVDNQRVIKELEKLDGTKMPFRFYFDTGTLEGVENSRRVNVLLRGKGFPIVYEEGETGHNWTSWRDRLADAFIALWK